MKSYRALLSHPSLAGVGIVVGMGRYDEVRLLAPEALFVVEGGDTRTQSAARGIEAVPLWAEAALIHDAARPFLTHETISRVVSAVASVGAAFPAIPVTDTIKQREGESVRTLDRAQLVAVQTPQGARIEHFRKAYKLGIEATDDMALLEVAGINLTAVAGDPENIKVTTEADLRGRGQVEVRTGLGYDIHRFSSDPDRPLWLGGVLFEGEGPGLEGHSDADSLVHAVVDSLMGAAGLGDIGEHYPNTDPRWKNEPSATFLKETGQMLSRAGWEVVNIDVSVLAERPRVSPRREEVRSTVAGLLGIDDARVSIKATTNEGLGAIGRGEGVAAFAVATIKRETW
jgi:2-C-methyl-D-erythritol 4-phosphate cytidylyltransferase/2-C-methyl-D-erythritol 2,4-cyclodiphosphate synthase